VLVVSWAVRLNSSLIWMKEVADWAKVHVMSVLRQAPAPTFARSVGLYT
jgi:hypothetical protein